MQFLNRPPRPNLTDGLAHKLHAHQVFRRQTYTRAGPGMGKSKLAKTLVALGRADEAPIDPKLKSSAHREWLRVDGENKDVAADQLADWLERKEPVGLVVDDAELIHDAVVAVLERAFDAWPSFFEGRETKTYPENHPVRSGPRVVLLASVEPPPGSLLSQLDRLDFDPWRPGWEEDLEEAWRGTWSKVQATLRYTIGDRVKKDEALDDDWFSLIKEVTGGFPPLVSAAFLFSAEKYESRLARNCDDVREFLGKASTQQALSATLDEAARVYAVHAGKWLTSRVEAGLVDLPARGDFERVLTLLGFPRARKGHPSESVIARVRAHFPDAPALQERGSVTIQLRSSSAGARPEGHVQKLRDGRPAGLPLVLRGAQWEVLRHIWERDGAFCPANEIAKELDLKVEVARTYVSRLSKTLKDADLSDVLLKEYGLGNAINTSVLESRSERSV